MELVKCNVKGTPQRSSHVTHFQIFFSKTHILLLPTYLVYQSLFLWYLNMFAINLATLVDNKNKPSNIKLFSRLMRRIQWNDIESSFWFHKCCFYFRIFGFFGVLFLFIGLFCQNNKSDLKLHLYPLYWYQWLASFKRFQYEHTSV